MPRGPDKTKRKPRGPTKWRIYSNTKINSLLTTINTIQAKLNALQKELSNG